MIEAITKALEQVKDVSEISENPKSDKFDSISTDDIDPFGNSETDLSETEEVLENSEENNLASLGVDDIDPLIDPNIQNKEIKETPSYSEEVKKSMTSPEEEKIYQKIGLKEIKVNDRIVLRSDDTFDPDFKDTKGRTNKERMENGLAPIGKDGKSVELHHIGQKMDSPLAEISSSDHKENHGEIHTNFTESEIDRNKFANERSDYWKERAKAF